MPYAVRSTSAWDRYRDECRQGRRKHCEPVDALCMAAYCDACGLDRLDQGELSLADMWFRESAAILLNHASQAAA